MAPTELEIVPAQLTTQAPAIFNTRVTNRGIADATNVTVTIKVDTTVIGTDVITVPAGGDAYATIGWSPNITGSVTISATITGVPTGDNLDDNTIAVQREIIDTVVPLIIIDNGHDNRVFSSGDGDDSRDDLVAYGYNWIDDTDGITTTDLTNASLLIISDPGEEGEDWYTEAEEEAIAQYVENGGALLISGDSDYSNNGNPAEINSILAKIDDAGIRMNNDGTYDDTNNGGGGPFHVLWHTFPATATTGIGVNVDINVGFSGCSIYGVDGAGDPIALTTGNGITVTVAGDDDTYQNDDNSSGHYYTYTVGGPDPIPMTAIQELPGGGRIAVWGDSQEAFSNAFTYVPSDGYQNEIYDMQTIYRLLGRPLEKSTIAEARADAELNDTPDNLDTLVWVEGTVTAGEGDFYEMSYVQDDTGGIAINYPSLDLSSVLTVGMQVRVVGRLEINQNETNIEIAWDPEQVQIIGQGTAPDPMALSTYSATLEQNEGWLTVVHGLVTTVTSDYEIYIDDGSGPVRVSIAGSGTFAGIQVGDELTVIGLASEDDQGSLIRLRGQEDVLNNFTYFPIIMK